MLEFSNPRLLVEIDDYPIGGSNRGKCVFKVEDGGKKGQRATRTTTNKFGLWNKPKLDTYATKVAIVDGNDNRTYVLRYIAEYARVSVRSHDFMSVPNEAYGANQANGYLKAELLAIIDAAS